MEKSYERAIEEFDLEQYKKDITQLNELTSRIIKNNPIYAKGYKLQPDCTTLVHDYSDNSDKYINVPPDTGFKVGDVIATREKRKENPVFQKEVDESILRGIKQFGNEYVGKELSNEILEKSREKLTDDRPPLAKDLSSLGLYGVYTISDNKFDAHYLDFVLSDKEEDKSVSIDQPVDRIFKDSLRQNLENSNYMTNLELRLFSAVGRMTEKFVPVTDNKRIEVCIKDYVNDEYVKFVKNLSCKNIDEKLKHLREPFLVQELNKDTYSKLCNRISMVSNFIATKSRRGGATFIYASKENINLIVDAFSGYWWKDGKTFKYNKTSGNFNYDLVANNDLGDTVIMGRCPKENEIGINLVINKNTLTNYVYSEEDVSGINLSFDFFAFGKHPEDNYFTFELKQ